jgi:hypothetical protein
VPNLAIRKLADQDADRVKLFDPFTGQSLLYEPADAEVLSSQLREALSGFETSPRPLLGITVEGETPQETKLGERFIANGRAEGWIEVEGEEIVHRSSGPPENPWGTPAHTFVHLDTIILKTVDGDVRYTVTENPDKWPEEKDGEAGFGGEVRWYYEVELES